MSSGFGGNQFFNCHIEKFIGETVTVFTTSGGLSGSGFTGVVLAVNCGVVRLVVRQGSAPANPLGENFNRDRCDDRRHERCCHKAGAVVDIPIDRIACFVHNAI